MNVLLENCPKCFRLNYFNKEDTINNFEVEGLECWKCHYKWLIDECRLETDEENETLLEDCILMRGMPSGDL